ncbi:MAG TPA: hypothetical protein VIO61_16815 [Anaerolineaceae bacterium]
MPSDLTLYDITGGNTAHLADLTSLFTQLFPQYAHRAYRLEIKAKRAADFNPRFIEHQFLAVYQEQPAGFVTFKYAPQRNLGLGIYLGVLPAFRSLRIDGSTRLSHYLIRASNEQLANDAQHCGNTPPEGYVVEVEEPKLVERYGSYGFFLLPVAYQEPLLEETASKEAITLAEGTFRPAALGFFPARPEGFDPAQPDLLRRAVLLCLVDHYGLAKDHWAVRQALNSII